MCDSRDDVGHIPVETESVQQWQCSMRQVTEFIAVSLDIKPRNKQVDGEKIWEIGLIAGKKFSKTLYLKADGDLTLSAGKNGKEKPLAEVIVFENGKYTINKKEITRMVDSADHIAKNILTVSSKDWREAKTKERNSELQERYKELKKMYPDKSDDWCARKIAKEEDIAKGLSPETIRKKMKGR
jgi:hypothetical protein